MSELAEALYRHLLSLLPPGRYPRAGGAADGMVRALAQEEADLIREALEAFPQAFPQYAEGEALSRLGEGRALRRFPPDEPDAFYRERVRHAWDWWLRAGTKPGMEAELARLGFHARVIEGPFETYFDGTWNFGDYEGAFTGPAWAEFLLRIWPQGPFQTRERAYLRQVVRELKPAHAVLRGVELYAQDRRVFRLRPQAAVVLLDLGAFGDFLFGDTRRVALAGGMSLAAWAEGRMAQAQVFDGSWRFGEVGF
ncbi:phage tail protein [Thermus scotoductus]|uniref:Uncharacterized protein n=1 Tax=Thermus scotoductus TaxID=37636 RepID=A0A430RY19_THESC|nr:phage tail protein [Thermus scotoductus]RTG92914.1 hypothetical protein CSW51_10020 [Thermus scotoductus]RTH25902.1 hypothetical protein CSW38_07060 [Thermus scotoductus]